MKKKYLIFRELTTDIDHYDNYHTSSVVVPTEYIVELTEIEAKRLRAAGFLALEILTQAEVKEALQEEIKKAKEWAAKMEQREKEKAQKEKQRLAKIEAKRKEKELAKLKELQEKYRQ